MTQRTLEYGLTPKLLRRISQWAKDNPAAAVLSVYINLNPEDFQTQDARQTTINSALTAARETADGLADECIDKIQEKLDSNDDLQEATGLAIFCGADTDLFEILILPQAVETESHFGTVHLKPLLDMQASDKWCILLVNRENARIFLGNEHSLNEVSQVTDEVKNQHKKGGWSQARFERSVDREVKWHLDNASEEVFEFLMEEDFDHLLIAAPDGLQNKVEENLHSYLLEKLIGFVTMDVDNSTEDEVADMASQEIANYRQKELDDILARFEENHGRGESASAGLSATLEALVMQRVETLLLSEEAERSGVYCPKCGHLAVQGKECPLDGSTMLKEEDILERAIEAAALQAANIRLLPQDALLEHKGVAALLRF